MSATAADESAERFQVRVTSDSHFAWIRTRLAIERTMMAAVRTAVALIGFGFTIVQFFQHLNTTEGVAAAARPEAPRYLGLALIGAGILTLLVSGVLYRRVVHYLWCSEFRPIAGVDKTGFPEPVIRQSPVLAVTLLMVLIGVTAFVAVMTRIV
jgi:putative membrane protein